MTAHICGEGEVEAMIAPNRYRVLFSEHPKSPETHEEEQKACLEKMRAEFPDKAARALGMGICTCFEPILQWENV